MSTSSTMLDYLNEDCWRAVLDRVPVRDIIRSERASRGWQRVVLRYLSQTRIAIQYPILLLEDVSAKTAYNARWLRLHEKHLPSFNSWTSKLGASVVACYCTEKSLKIVGEKCPNLEAVTFIELEQRQLRNKQYENLTRLKMISFQSCDFLTDRCAAQFLASPNLQELEFSNTAEITGQCLKKIKSKNLKTLILNSCEELSCRHMLQARDILGRLTKFELHIVERLDPTNYVDMLQVLGKMKQLEGLIMYVYDDGGLRLDDFFKFVCRFENLKELAVDFPATDEDLETLATGCPRLVSLNLLTCFIITGRGLARLCASAGTRLERLSLARSPHVTDSDVVACIRACPKLVELGVASCTGLSSRVLARAAAARRELRARRPLRLLVFAEDLHDGFSDSDEEDIVERDYRGLELPYINVRTRTRWSDLEAW